LALVEMLSIGAHAVRRAQVGEGDTVLVLGAGPIGLSIAAFARLLTRDVVVTDLNKRRRDFCRRHLEVKACLDGQGDVAAQVRSEFGGDLPTVVFDATGSPKSMMQAPQYLVNGGRLALVSLVSGDLTFHDPQLHRLELTLYCCRNSVGADFEWAIVELEAGRIDVDPWITHRATADQIVTEFVKWLDPDQGVVKAVVELK
jgi:threonine dehydrogenase-like Zn-dependent dehydrogenase